MFDWLTKESVLWIVPAAPLAACLWIVVVNQFVGRQRAHRPLVVAMFISWLAAICLATTIVPEGFAKGEHGHGAESHDASDHDHAVDPAHSDHDHAAPADKAAEGEEKSDADSVAAADSAPPPMSSGSAGDADHAHEEHSHGDAHAHGVKYPVGNHAVVKFVYQWMKVGKVDVAVTLRADAMSALMLLMVTSVSLLVAIFAGGYMHGDPGYPRFFAAMALFVFSMCMLVLAGNFLLMFVFWEAVGLCSYLLIGYWYKKPSAAAAAKKAFVVNRIGDFGFILGVFMVWVTFGTVDFETLFGDPAFIPQVLSGIDPAIVTTICILLFIGAIGKSAQFPLHVWLPDAMEGPTPVSALIHAATMVTAGVYLVARCAPLFVLSPTALSFVAIIGATTAILAAFTALTQYDLKRVLAYSTVSQLGFMFMSLGAAAADPVHLMQPAVTFAMFHMFTHAFFKAVLFLSAGSVMHSMGDVIDMRRFSGLKKVMPVTHWTFLAGAAALAGLPLLSGFWSKDEILAVLSEAARVPGNALFFGSILGIAMLASLMTAFYTFRAYFLTFHGPERFPEEAGHHPHEAPPAMAWPLRILGVAAIVVGAIAGPTHLYAHYLQHTPSLPVSEPHGLNYLMMAISSIIAIVGVGYAWMVYGKDTRKAYNVEERYSPAYELSLQGLHLDAVYQALVVRPMQALSELSETLDRLFVDKLVDAVGYLPGIFGSLVRPIQNGFLQSYALVMLLGLVIFVFGVLRAIAGM